MSFVSRILVHFDVGDPGLHVEIVDFLKNHRFVEVTESVYEGSLTFGPQMVGLRPKALYDFFTALVGHVRANPRFGVGDRDLVVVEWASNGTIVPERISP